MSLCWDTGGMCSDDTGARGSIRVHVPTGVNTTQWWWACLKVEEEK